MKLADGRVEHYFASNAPFWKDVYGQTDVFSGTMRRRHAIALSWIERLNLEPGTRVLEVGCGAGLLSVALAQRGMSVQAIDPVPPMVVEARRSAEEAHVGHAMSVRVGDAHRLHFVDGSFTLVAALGVLPWLRDPEQAIQEMARVLKPGGWLVLSADNRDRLPDLLDPVRNPALTGVKRTIKGWLLGTRASAAPRARADRRKDVDCMLDEAGLRKLAGVTCGFAPLTLFWRRVLPERIEARVERWLQALADRGLPGIRSTGWHYIVLAEKLP